MQVFNEFAVLTCDFLALTCTTDIAHDFSILHITCVIISFLISVIYNVSCCETLLIIS